MMPQQMPDTEVESEQLFDFSPPATPPPPLKERNLLSRGLLHAPVYQAAGFLSDPTAALLGRPVYCSGLQQMGAPGPGGVAVRALPLGGGCGGDAPPEARPPSRPAPVYSPERCKSVSSSRRPHLFLHLLQLLV